MQYRYFVTDADLLVRIAFDDDENPIRAETPDRKNKENYNIDNTLILPVILDTEDEVDEISEDTFLELLKDY